LSKTLNLVFVALPSRHVIFSACDVWKVSTLGAVKGVQPINVFLKTLLFNKYFIFK